MAVLPAPVAASGGKHRQECLCHGHRNVAPIFEERTKKNIVKTGDSRLKTLKILGREVPGKETRRRLEA